MALPARACSRPFCRARFAPVVRFPPSQRLNQVAVRATPDSEPNKPESDAPVATDDRLEQLEAAIRNKQVKPVAARKIPIRGITEPEKPRSATLAEWKENSLVPEGWDNMSTGQKLRELYVGERGLLFWANKIAFASCIALAGAWVVFRFVGPALGLYTLQSDPSLPPL